MSDEARGPGRLRPWGFISRQELIRALLTVPQETAFTIYEIHVDAALPGEKSMQVLPMKIGGKELLVKLAVPAGTVREST